MTIVDRKLGERTFDSCRWNVFATSAKSMGTTRQNISYSTWRTARHIGVQSAKLKIITQPSAIWTWRIEKFIMQSTRPLQLHKITSKKTYQTIRTIKDTTVENTSAGMTIDMEDLEVEVNSLGIETTNHVSPSNVSHVTRKDTDMQTIHTRTGLT